MRHSGEGLQAVCDAEQRGYARSHCVAQAAIRSCAELKETLLHKHEAHTALRTELKRAQVRL